MLPTPVNEPDIYAQVRDHMRRFADEAEPLQDVEWRQQLASLCEQLGLRIRPQLLRSPRDVTPMTWGLLRTVIMLPTGCDTWTAEQRPS